jgi:hypothetical protein
MWPGAQGKAQVAVDLGTSWRMVGLLHEGVAGCRCKCCAREADDVMAVDTAEPPAREAAPVQCDDVD